VLRFKNPMLLVNAYLDGELDPAARLAFEQQMAADPALAAKCVCLETLQRLLRERLPREAAPPGLRARIEASVRIRRPRVQPCWPALVALIAITAMVASGSTGVAFSPEQIAIPRTTRSSPPHPVTDGATAAGRFLGGVL
jgi:anti-sigma factor RsiW